jgi:hypothetical protein
LIIQARFAQPEGNTPDRLADIEGVMGRDSDLSRGTIRRQPPFDFLLGWDNNGDIPLDNGLARQGITLGYILRG